MHTYDPTAMQTVPATVPARTQRRRPAAMTTQLSRIANHYALVFRRAVRSPHAALVSTVNTNANALHTGMSTAMSAGEKARNAVSAECMQWAGALGATHRRAPAERRTAGSPADSRRTPAETARIPGRMRRVAHAPLHCMDHAARFKLAPANYQRNSGTTPPP